MMSEDDELEFWENSTDCDDDLTEWELNELAKDHEGHIEICVDDSVELEGN